MTGSRTGSSAPATSRTAAELRERSRGWQSWDLTPRQLCDLELLMNGAFAPLDGFMGRADYDRVCADMRLADGTLWPIPITLDVPDAFATGVSIGSTIALRDSEGVMLAAMHVEEIWTPDRVAEAEAICGTSDVKHPGAHIVLERLGGNYVGGRIEPVQLPGHYDFRELRLAPAELRADFASRRWTSVAVLMTRGPLHRADIARTQLAARSVGSHVLVHVEVGPDLVAGLQAHTRVRSCQQVMSRFASDEARLAVIPMASRAAGARETLWTAIVERNAGCTHLIATDDGAGADMVRRHRSELGIDLVDAPSLGYSAATRTFVERGRAESQGALETLSTEDVHRRLSKGEDVPEWFTFPEVLEELHVAWPPRHQQGFTIFFTGLSGAGKSTVANALRRRLQELTTRPMTLLDGDLVRKHLSSELGFSKAHRDLNIRRIAFVASEITKHGGIAICAPIAPYRSMRDEARQMVESVGGFVLVHVSAPLEVCEERDRKGLYAKARSGVIGQFTGISDPYETPDDADVTIDTSQVSPHDAVERILDFLRGEGYLRDQRG